MIPAFHANGRLPPGVHKATFSELVKRFGGEDGGPRQAATLTLEGVISRLKAAGVEGRLIIGGSYISATAAPRDVDILLVAAPDIPALKERSQILQDTLDARLAEERGYSILYCPEDSPVLELVMSVWDVNRYGERVGVIEVQL